MGIATVQPDGKSMRRSKSSPQLARARNQIDPSASAPACVFGVSFENRLGLAAGLDRTGRNFEELARCGVGHIEIGTLTDSADLEFRYCGHRRRTKVGISIASRRPGLDQQVIDDYLRLSRNLSSTCDFLVANLSSPHHARNGNSRGIERLLEALKLEHDTHQDEPRCPLLVKLGLHEASMELPVAVNIARDLRLDGVVIATPSMRILERVSRELHGIAVISVGGIGTLNDAKRRLCAGASLVQVHSAYARRGPACIADILGDGGHS